jgi:nitrilase
MIVDAWGRVVASRDCGPGVVVADVDPNVASEARARLPALGHRVL